MPRYHFEIIDGFRLEDPVGLVCQNNQQAHRVADDIARQIVLDVGENAARKVLVVDENGSEIYVTPIER
jgi:hypothetical protein